MKDIPKSKGWKRQAIGNVLLFSPAGKEAKLWLICELCGRGCPK